MRGRTSCSSAAIIPNKKIEDVIRSFHAYQVRHNPRARLLLVGSYAGFEPYLAMLQRLIADLGAPDVHFLGHVSNEELAACYEVGDLFLCASEHEGFCVPLIEAFHVRMPVLAYAATAIPATLDGGGLLYEDKDPAIVAALMNVILTDDRLEARILETQDAALARLRARDFAGLVRGFVARVIAEPPREAPPIAFDFWDQFALGEQLETLHQYRPAAYAALPKASSMAAPADEA